MSDDLLCLSTHNFNMANFLLRKAALFWNLFQIIWNILKVEKCTNNI